MPPGRSMARPSGCRSGSNGVIVATRLREQPIESRGVEFVTETIDSGVCKQAIFQDPDGNSLAIHHRYAR